MPSFDLGKMIKRLRKQKGISQEELAFPIIDRTTLSKIESGKAMPHRKTLEFLLDRLGYDSNEFVSHFLAPEDVEVQSAIDELNNLLRTVVRKANTEAKQKMCVKVDALINRLEQNKVFIQHPLNMQFLLDVKARHAYNLQQDKKAAEYARQALKIVIPHFDEQNIPDYYLNKQCNNMLVLLAMIYAEEGRYDNAINILYGLLENIKITYNDINIQAKLIISTSNNLARILLQANRPQEAFDISEAAIQICIQYNNEALFYKSLCWFQARALLAQGKTEAFIEMSRKLYCAYDVYRQEWTKNHIRETVLEATGVDIAHNC
ncbi:MAG: helix-turn-helix transcriptional regulator [Defluviitaleaceae bacterium]|nr:helix-turn-helix transcriptional regulator [Defluviitaleaceae bacterium]